MSFSLDATWKLLDADKITAAAPPPNIWVTGIVPATVPGILANHHVTDVAWVGGGDRHPKYLQLFMDVPWRGYLDNNAFRITPSFR